MLDLVQSAALFREAAGVFQYLANEVFPSLQSAQSAGRPPETIPSMSTVMSLICLAEAQVRVKAFTFQYGRISVPGSWCIDLKFNSKSYKMQAFEIVYFNNFCLSDNCFTKKYYRL